MIIYAVAARVSVARMFLAGFIPGMLIGLLMMCLIYFMASKNPEQFRTGTPFDYQRTCKNYQGNYLGSHLPGHHFIWYGGGHL